MRVCLSITGGLLVTAARVDAGITRTDSSRLQCSVARADEVARGLLPALVPGTRDSFAAARGGPAFASARNRHFRSPRKVEGSLVLVILSRLVVCERVRTDEGPASPSLCRQALEARPPTAKWTKRTSRSRRARDCCTLRGATRTPEELRRRRGPGWRGGRCVLSRSGSF